MGKGGEQLQIEALERARNDLRKQASKARARVEGLQGANAILREKLADAEKRIAKLEASLTKAFAEFKPGDTPVEVEKRDPLEHKIGGPIEMKDTRRRDAWRSLEAGSAEDTGGEDRPRPNKGDGTAYGRRFTRECKNTEGQLLGVRRRWLRKLREEAGRAGRLPLFVMGFGPDEFDGFEERWACFPLDHGKKCIEAMAESVAARDKED